MTIIRLAITILSPILCKAASVVQQSSMTSQMACSTLVERLNTQWFRNTGCNDDASYQCSGVFLSERYYPAVSSGGDYCITPYMAYSNYIAESEAPQGEDLHCPWFTGTGNDDLNDMLDGHFSVSYMRSDFDQLGIWNDKGAGVIFDNEMIFAARDGSNSPLLSVSMFDQGSQAGKWCGMNRTQTEGQGRESWAERRACFGNLISDLSANRTFESYNDIVRSWPEAFKMAFKEFLDDAIDCKISDSVTDSISRCTKSSLPHSAFDSIYVDLQRQCSDAFKRLQPKSAKNQHICTWDDTNMPYNEFILQTWGGLKFDAVPIMGYFYTDDANSNYIQTVKKSACSFSQSRQDVAMVKLNLTRSRSGLSPFSCEEQMNVCDDE